MIFLGSHTKRPEELIPITQITTGYGGGVKLYRQTGTPCWDGS